METKKNSFLMGVLLTLLIAGVFTIAEDAAACKCMISGSSVCSGDSSSCSWTDTGMVGTTCSDINGFIDGANRDSGHACYRGKSNLSNHSVCLIGDLGIGRYCKGDTGCTSTIDTYKYCKEDKCNTYYNGDGAGDIIDDSSTNGASCIVTTVGKDTCANSLSGKWDNTAGEKKCVTCNGKKELKVLGDSTDTYVYWNSTAYTTDENGDGAFEKACDDSVDASCDEKNVGDGCGGTNICDADGKCVAPATCDTNPTVEVSPPSQSSSKGDTLTYTIKVTNNDDASCVTASRIFNLTQAQPGGWGVGSFGSTSLTVNKDDSENTTYDLTSPGSAAVGNYTFTITATDNADGSKKHSADGVYNVTNCPSGIDPDDEFKFTGNLYVKGDGGTVTFGEKTLGLSLDNSGTANAYTIWIKNPGGHIEATGTVAAGASTFLSYTLKPGDSSGIWTGEISSATDCRVATTAVECTEDSHCAGTDVCNSDNECEAAPAPAPAPAPATCSKTEDSEVTCDDGIDNDCDGFFDCDDITCVGTPACSVLPPSPGPTACDPNSWFFCNPLRTNVETLAQGGKRIIGYILGLIGSVALLLVIISGAMYMTSAGNEERIASSKRILTGAVIGLGIALLAYSLLAVIMNVLNM